MLIIWLKPLTFYHRCPLTKVNGNLLIQNNNSSNVYCILMQQLFLLSALSSHTFTGCGGKSDIFDAAYVQ
jgi:hypothetical protein